MVGAPAKHLITDGVAVVAHTQSVSATATVLHCHRNTANYRLRRFAELTGGSLADNAWLSQVVLAIQAPLPT
jgi:DNA-binding PucR family transcriptional regulator